MSNLAELTRDEIEDIYYNGNYWVDNGYGADFDFVAFGKRVALRQREKAVEQANEAARNQCTCAYEGSPCPTCRKRTGYDGGNV